MAPPISAIPLSLREQIGTISTRYPQFILLSGAGWLLLWHGEIRPLAQSYQIQLLYSTVALPFAGIGAFVPHVEVIDPVLVPYAGEKSTIIPHVFPNKVMPDRPRLCLYRQKEWTPFTSLADTIVPWTIEWLIGYEGWRATGEWLAGGHGTERGR
jgi:hypothetical protein